jgi:surface-anchored protein
MGWVRAAAAAAIAGLLVACGPVGAQQAPAARPAPSIVLSEGHADAFQPKLVDGKLVLFFDDDTGAQRRSVDPTDVLMVVNPAARVSVPEGSTFGFLGGPGASVWVLPQTQESGILWPGLTTKDLVGQWEGNRIQLHLRAVAPPPDGRFFLYEINVLLEPRRLWSSDDLANSTFNVPLDTHAHMNWAFTQPGVYVLQVEVCGRHVGPGAELGRLCSGVVPYTIDVKA